MPSLEPAKGETAEPNDSESTEKLISVGHGWAPPHGKTPPENRARTDIEDSSDESKDGDLQWSTMKCGQCVCGRAQSLYPAKANLLVFT